MERFSWQVVERLTGRPSGPTVRLMSIYKPKQSLHEGNEIYDLHILLLKHSFANSVI